MPSIDVPSIDFELYCGICGSGVCHDTRDTSNRRGHAFTVTCSTCEKNISDLEARITELEQRLEDWHD
jgi:hypothetical protein